MKVQALALVGLLMLAGCGTQPKPLEPRTVVQRVEVPIRVPCKTERPTKPTYAADAISLDANIFELVRALLQEREQRKAYEAEANGALDRCS